MFPITDSIRALRFPFLNLSLVGITVYIFIQQILASNTESFIYQYALIPTNVNFADINSLIPFVTAIFLHGGFLHILSNMWFLIVFGDNVETHLSPIAFLVLYFVAGIVGNIAQFLLMTDSSVPMLGASGAVAGILGCYYILFPHSKIKTLVIIVFFITIINLSASIWIGIWFIIQLFSGVASLPGAGDQGGVAFFAHIGGFITGILFGLIYKNKAAAQREYDD